MQSRSQIGVSRAQRVAFKVLVISNGHEQSGWRTQHSSKVQHNYRLTLQHCDPQQSMVKIPLLGANLAQSLAVLTMRALEPSLAAAGAQQAPQAVFHKWHMPNGYHHTPCSALLLLHTCKCPNIALTGTHNTPSHHAALLSGLCCQLPQVNAEAPVFLPVYCLTGSRAVPAGYSKQQQGLEFNGSPVIGHVQQLMGVSYK